MSEEPEKKDAAGAPETKPAEIKDAAGAPKATKPAAVKKDAEAKKPAAMKRSKDVQILRVSGPERGRRRAGHHFGAEQVELRIEDLTEEQVAAIQADPQLTSAIGTRTEEIEAEDA